MIPPLVPRSEAWIHRETDRKTGPDPSNQYEPPNRCITESEQLSSCDPALVRALQVDEPSESVEWPGGVAPPGSHRTGLEPLDSSGSCYPALSDTSFQWANMFGLDLAIPPRNRAARWGLYRIVLYFHIAQRIRYVLI